MMCWPGSNAVTLNGPEPTGRLFLGFDLMSCPSSKTCFGRIGVSAEDSTSRIAGCGCFMRMTTVCGSGASKASTGSSMLEKGWFSLTTPSDQTTSSAVIGWPSWKVAPLRSVRVSTLLSSLNSQLSAR